MKVLRVDLLAGTFFSAGFSNVTLISKIRLLMTSYGNSLRLLRARYGSHTGSTLDMFKLAGRHA
jgi:hypothetical protein